MIDFTKIKPLYLLNIAFTIVLLTSLLVDAATTRSITVANEGYDYDPWVDTNDDGIIDIFDLVAVAQIFGTEGTPINKTALLLELQDKIDNLNTSILDLETYLNTRIDNLNTSVIDLRAYLITRIVTLETDLAALQSIVGALEDRIATLETEIVTLNASLVELQSKVEALETRIPKKGYISIPPPAFTPEYDSQSHDIRGWRLMGSGSFFANVQLPHGATITNITIYLYDVSPSASIAIALQFHDFHNNTWNYLARYDAAPPEETPGRVALSLDIMNASAREVDNQRYSYYVNVWLDGNSLNLYLEGVIIEYEYPM